MRIVRIAIVALLAVGILAFLLVPPFHHLVVDRLTAGVTTVRKAVHPKYVNVYPVTATATSQTAGHAAALTVDRTSNSYWGAIATDRAPQLVFTFSEPQDLSEIMFRSGAPGAQPSDFLKQPRPKAVHIRTCPLGVNRRGYKNFCSPPCVYQAISTHPVENVRGGGVTATC